MSLKDTVVELSKELVSTDGADQAGKAFRRKIDDKDRTKKCISERLRATRKERGLTQTQLALRTELKEITYSNYETGKCEPPVYVMVRLANELDVSIDYLVGRIDEDVYKNKDQKSIERLEERINALEKKIGK